MRSIICSDDQVIILPDFDEKHLTSMIDILTEGKTLLKTINNLYEDIQMIRGLSKYLGLTVDDLKLVQVEMSPPSPSSQHIHIDDNNDDDVSNVEPDLDSRTTSASPVRSFARQKTMLECQYPCCSVVLDCWMEYTDMDSNICTNNNIEIEDNEKENIIE